MANRYWVGDGGNWNDTTHWSTSTGGGGGASVPTIVDDVFFDVNSFSTTGQTVATTPVANSCKSMSWTGVTNNPTISGATGISMDGSVVFSSGVTANITLNLLNNLGSATSASVTSNGANLTGLSIQTNASSRTVDVLIIDDISIASMAIQTGGTFNSNNNDITINSGSFDFSSSASAIVMTLGTSIITLGSNSSFKTNSNVSLSASGVEIIVNGGTHSIQFNQGSGEIGIVTLNGGTITFSTSYSGISISTLDVSPGVTIELQTFTGTALAVTNFNANGLLGNLIILKSDTNTVARTLAATTASVSYINVRDNTASGDIPFINYGGTNGGNNTNWTFPASAPVANFSGTPLSGSSPLTVTFTDLSTNTPTSWLWDFGDGNTSTSQNPVNIYASPGFYTVSLTVTNPIGSDLETKINYINVSNINTYLQTTFMVGSDTAGDIQTMEVGKDDDGTPIYYELETQGLEFGNVFHRKKISDKIVVFTKDGLDSNLQGKTDGNNYKNIEVSLTDRVNIGQDILLEGNTVKFKWFGESTESSPILEGIYLEKVTDMGITHG